MTWNKKVSSSAETIIEVMKDYMDEHQYELLLVMFTVWMVGDEHSKEKLSKKVDSDRPHS